MGLSHFFTISNGWESTFGSWAAGRWVPFPSQVGGHKGATRRDEDEMQREITVLGWAQVLGKYPEVFEQQKEKRLPENHRSPLPGLPPAGPGAVGVPDPQVRARASLACSPMLRHSICSNMPGAVTHRHGHPLPENGPRCRSQQGCSQPGLRETRGTFAPPQLPT